LTWPRSYDRADGLETVSAHASSDDRFMKRETVRYLKDLAYYSSIGFQVALPIIICFYIGSYLDKNVFHSTPWVTLIFLALGIAAGFRNIALMIKKIRKL
jgi:ATP synthase protein I